MKLLLLAPSARMLAESARRAGYDFVALDYFGDRDTCEAGMCRSLNHTYGTGTDGSDRCLERLYSHVGDVEFTHLIYGSGFENHPEFVAELEGKYAVLGNGADALKRVRDWENFFAALRKMGVACPESFVIDREEINDFVGDWIVKPLRSGGGHGIYRLGEQVDCETQDEKVLIQGYINGKTISASLISNGRDAVCLSATEQLIGAKFNKYRYVGNIAPLEAGEGMLREIEEVSKKVVEEFGLVGSVGVDMIIADGVPYVIEVNPRFQGSMEVVERASGKNLVDLHVKACHRELDMAKLEDEVKLNRGRGYYGKRILFAEGDVKFSIEKDVYDFIKDVPHYGEDIKENDPMCTVLASGKTRNECFASLSRNEISVRQRLRAR